MEEQKDKVPLEKDDKGTSGNKGKRREQRVYLVLPEERGTEKVLNNSSSNESAGGDTPSRNPVSLSSFF